MQITGDKPEGKAELDNFIHPEERYPVVVTTSKLLTTGVDAQTCKVIVLDQNITLGPRVQADHRPRDAHRGGLREALLHHPRLPEGDRAVRRPRLRRRPGADLPAEAGRPVAPPDPLGRGGDRLPVPRAEAPPTGPVASAPEGDAPAPAEGGRPHQVRRRRRAGLRRGGAGPVLRQGRQAHHRVPPRLHEAHRAGGVRVARRIPQEVDRGRRASRPSSRSWRSTGSSSKSWPPRSGATIRRSISCATSPSVSPPSPGKSAPAT